MFPYSATQWDDDAVTHSFAQDSTLLCGGGFGRLSRDEKGAAGSTGMYEDVLSSLGLPEGAKLEKIFSPAGGGQGERLMWKPVSQKSLVTLC